MGWNAQQTAECRLLVYVCSHKEGTCSVVNFCGWWTFRQPQNDPGSCRGFWYLPLTWSTITVNDRSKPARNPFGGSLVTLMLIWSRPMGNLEWGSLVIKSRKSAWHAGRVCITRGYNAAAAGTGTCKTCGKCARHCCAG